MKAATAIQAEVDRPRRGPQAASGLMASAGTLLLPPAQRHALRQAIAMLDVNRRRLALAVLAGAGGLASAVGLAATSAWLIARASQMPPVMALTVAAVGVRLFAVSRTVLRYVERLASHDVALRGMTALRQRVYDELADAPADAVASLRRGDLLARTGRDVDAVGDVVVRAILPAAVTTLVGVLSVALVGWLHPGIGVVLAVCLLMAGAVGPWLTMRGARLDELAQVHQRGELAAVAESIAAHSGELTVSGRLTGAFERLRAVESDLARLKDAAARPAAWAAGLNTQAMGLALLGAIVIGVPATVSGQLEYVELAVVVLTPLAAFEGTAMLGPAAVQLVRSGGAAERILELLEAGGRRPGGPVPGSTPADPATRDETGASRATTLTGQEQLVARALRIGWPGGPDVATGVDLRLAPGRSLAVVGPSGVGKTTLLATLAGLLPPHDGAVRLISPAGEGVEDASDEESAPHLHTLDRATASAAVVLTAEDAHVFATTVLENLRVARGDVSEEEALRLLTRAGLGPWLAALPEGVHTHLESDAATMSGGERRRLLLARALASRAPLLLLDEPGEHLDPATADSLISDLLRTGAHGDRGVLLVTHRLSALEAADEVIVLGRPDPREPARILARGRHTDLMSSYEPYRWTVAQEGGAPD